MGKTTSSSEKRSFVEPAISEPKEVAGADRGRLMMAMIGGSGSGPGLDPAGFPPDGTGLD
jgi:hypothetical protein